MKRYIGFKGRFGSPIAWVAWQCKLLPDIVLPLTDGSLPIDWGRHNDASILLCRQLVAVQCNDAQKAVDLSVNLSWRFARFLPNSWEVTEEELIGAIERSQQP